MDKTNFINFFLFFGSLWNYFWIVWIFYKKEKRESNKIMKKFIFIGYFE